MVNFKINEAIKKRQNQLWLGIILGFFLLIMIIFYFISGSKASHKKEEKKALNLVGVVNESFTDAVEEKAINKQQLELNQLKEKLNHLNTTFKKMTIEQEKTMEDISKKMDEKLDTLVLSFKDIQNKKEADENLFNTNQENIQPSRLTEINTVSFRKRMPIKKETHLNPKYYVPSNTSAKAVVLGGADSDASVSGQSRNNGVMIFKFIDSGTLPNGARSRLSGCRVSANTYGDISSERAFGTLYKLSCYHKGEPIIDKEVSGWVFHNGKSGIKGQPLMRDNKIMQWAGISGAFSGIAAAAQASQSIQQLTPLSTNTVVPPSNMMAYSGYSGASKAADLLSQYYIKRAEQYHPVIQVGAGNVVTIVFKDGFYLEPEEDPNEVQNESNQKNASYHQNRYSDADDNQHSANDFVVPQSVFEEIDKTNEEAKRRIK